jgi:serine O-acetyltransferase
MSKKTPPPASCGCVMGSPESDICETASQLLRLFRLDGADAPDVLLTHGPAPKNVVDALRILLDVMFPGKISAAAVAPDELGLFLVRRLGELWNLLHPEIRRALPYRWIGEAARADGARPPEAADLDRESRRILKDFLATLPAVRKALVEDVQAAYDGDPAALTYAEVLLSYPGLLAIAAHRLAHELHKLDVPIVPRIMSEWIHTKSGVDIHPGATIGRAFFIDHATGVVVGETTRIGDHVKLYQGVTLGARSFALGANGLPVKHVQRHPTLQDHVVVYAHATILGGETVIGARSVVGSNVFLMESVPPDSVVSSIHPELSIREKKHATRHP